MNILETSDYAPHECPECKSAAYVGGQGNVECTNFRCRHFHEDTWERHVLSLPDPGDPEDEIDEDADTDPAIKLDSSQLKFWTDPGDLFVSGGNGKLVVSGGGGSAFDQEEVERALDKLRKLLDEVDSAIEETPLPLSTCVRRAGKTKGTHAKLIYDEIRKCEENLRRATTGTGVAYWDRQIKDLETELDKLDEWY